MTSETIESESAGNRRPRPNTRKANASPPRRPGLQKRRRAKKAANPKAERANKKAEVIALMKRAKGATLAEIMKATAWQPHTVRGFVSILGSKGGEKIESSKSATVSGRTRSSSPRAIESAKRRFRVRPGRRFLLQ